MADDPRRLILGNGEQYIRPVSKRSSGRSPEPPRSYSDARDLVKRGVTTALQAFEALPEAKKNPEEPVFCLRLHPDVTAKTYSPEAIFDDVPDLRAIGSRNYREDIERVAPTRRMEKQREKAEAVVSGRLVFVQSTPQGFERFLRQLDRPESRIKKQFREEIRRIERFDVLSPAEQIIGFPEDWVEGRAELIFHPTRSRPELRREFVFELFEEVGVEDQRSQVRQYPRGPTFISCRLTRKSLDALAGTNPLRAAHPLSFEGLTDLRSASMAAAPQPPKSTTRSTIKVGMFDGGIDPNLPLLRGHVEEDRTLEIKTPPEALGVMHGTAVAGALLYGELNGRNAKHELPAPPVYVVSIRALPTSDPADVDLYEAIDVVEKAVPARSDIKVFNLSFGPTGPIEDDTLSRFTYVLDSLAVTHKVTFFVAVGNTGDLPDYERIQAPSDLVHGVGVGAFTMNGPAAVHAAYSCRGPGRECGKVKPDLAAFGGCENTPMHLVSTAPGKKLLHWGTSFAAPLASRLGAQASEGFERSSTLLARALLVHTAIHPEGDPDHLLGHGCVMPTVSEVLSCEEKSVTVVFRGDILPTHMVRLPVPWPEGIAIPGKVHISWTIAALSPVDPNHPGDYTNCCLEETFYPHGLIYQFAPPKGQRDSARRLHLSNDSAAITALVAQGWKRAEFPIPESGNAYRDESARRLDCKWEPLVRRELTKNASKLHSPFLVLHAIGRNNAIDRFEYVAVVTVSAPKFEGDLYDRVRSQYPALAPIRLRSEAEIRVRI
jgi:hypothetical protein